MNNIEVNKISEKFNADTRQRLASWYNMQTLSYEMYLYSKKIKSNIKLP
jgi:hypothetical protein